jgi:hypothetical protein
MGLSLEVKESIKKLFGGKRKLSFVERYGSLVDDRYLEGESYVEEYVSVERLIKEIEETVEGFEGREVRVKIGEKGVEVRGYNPGTRDGHVFLWNIEERRLCGVISRPLSP